MELAKLYRMGGLPQPWQDVEGLLLEVPYPPMDTRGMGGM
jgi:hypothetical protein